MKRFSELGVNVNSGVFQADMTSIRKVVNCEIEVIDFHPDVDTHYGEGRMVVLIRQGGTLKKFFTNCAQIKDTLKAINKEDFPFMATKMK